MQITIDELQGLSGSSLGTSDWKVVTQEMIDKFADVTGDHQWIHVDPERAKSGPFGTTIAHGYLSLSLVSAIVTDLVDVTDAAQGINYGLSKARFPAPVPTGSRVRGTANLDRVTDLGGGVQLELTVTLECEGQVKPVCVAEPIFRYYR